MSRRPPRGLASRDRGPAGRSTSTWIAVVAVVALLAYIGVNSVRTRGVGSRGVPVGTVLPPFAVPTADNPDDEVPANTLLVPHDGAPKACDVRVAHSFTSCALTARTPAVLAFLAAPSSKCADDVDKLARLRPRFPGVTFAVVAVRGKRSALRRLVRRHDWTGLRIGHDTDGRVANAYGVAVCPTVMLAARGGKVTGTVIGDASQAELAKRIGTLTG